MHACMRNLERRRAIVTCMFAAGLRAFSCGKSAKSDKGPFLAASRTDDDGESGTLPGRPAAGSCREEIACLSGRRWRPDFRKDALIWQRDTITYTHIRSS